MNSLVGYGSSDSESDDEVKPSTSSLTAKLESAKLPEPPGPSTSNSPLFAQGLAPSSIDQKLDISDDEDSYVRSKSSLSSNSHSSTPQSSNSSPFIPNAVATTPNQPKIPENISHIIQQAEIVKVNTESLQSKEGVISSLLPTPKQKLDIHELELESLHKNKRRKKDKKKIFALSLEDFLEPAEEDKPKVKRPLSSNSKCSLFSILPEPRNQTISTKSTKSVVSSSKTIFKPRTIPKATPFITPDTSASNEDVIEDNDTSSDFFSFDKAAKETKEINNIAKSIKLDKYIPTKVTATPETFKVQGELRSIDSITTPILQQDEQLVPSSESLGPLPTEHIPAEFRDMVFNEADIIDVNQEIQPTEEWALKNLNYNDTKPQSSTKCPVGGQTKRKNQIGYLAWKAKEKEAELQNMWANNKMNRYQTQNRYGFR